MNELLTMDEVAKLFRVSRRTVERWAKELGLPVVKFGRFVRVEKEELDIWIANQIGKKS